MRPKPWATASPSATTLAEGLRAGAEGSAATVERLRQALAEAQAGVDQVAVAAADITAERERLQAYVRTLGDLTSGANDALGATEQRLQATLADAETRITGLVEQINAQANTVDSAARITETLSRTAQAEAQAAAEKAAEQQLAVVELALMFMGVSQQDLQAQMEAARTGLGQQPPELSPRFLTEVVKTRKALVAAKTATAERTARASGLPGRPVTPPRR